MITVGSDFSGVGAFNQSLNRLGIDYNEVFACDMDKYARQTYIYNYGEPKYYPENVYDREIPKKSLDVYMTSPPCQGFSIAGKRGGSILFLNSHEFIVKNKPRYFIFENVKGLLSHEKKNKDDDYGNTFNQWINYLGGKSVNGNSVIFPHEESVPYHIYHKVINAKKCGVPQNRERVFIVGIRDDVDNTFTWPKDIPLEKRLKDVLEDDVAEKYYLSEKMINYLHTRSANFNNYKGENDTASCITKSSSSLDISDNIIKIGNTNPSGNGMNGNVFDAKGISPSITTNKGEGIKVRFVTKKGCEIVIGAIRGRNPENPTSRKVGIPTEQRLELNQNGTSNALTTVQKDNVVIQLNPSLESGGKQPYQQNRVYDVNGINPSLMSGQETWGGNIINTHKIRRLTPTECFRLMDFPDTFKWNVSDSQAYKQAGNSIVVACLTRIISKLNLKTTT